MLLAGCVAAAPAAPAGVSSGPAAASGPATFDETTGAIEGTVFDAESQPIEGAIVGVIQLGTQVSTDIAGHFSFSNLLPGAYQVAGQKLGYSAAAKQVQVVAGEIAPISLVLEKLEIKQAYHTTFNVKGYFECSWTFVITTGPCFYPVTGTNTSYVPVDPWTNNKRQFDYSVGPGVMTMLNEMTWSQTTAATGDQMSVFMSYQGRSGNHWYCRAEHANPVTLRWDRDPESRDNDDAGSCSIGTGAQLPDAEPQTIPIEGQTLTSRGNTGPGTYTPTIGFALQQSFDLYVSAFYWEPAPDGFTGLADG